MRGPAPDGARRARHELPAAAPEGRGAGPGVPGAAGRSRDEEPGPGLGPGRSRQGGVCVCVCVEVSLGGRLGAGSRAAVLQEGRRVEGAVRRGGSPRQRAFNNARLPDETGSCKQ